MGSTARIILDQDKKKRNRKWWWIIRLLPITIAGILCYKFALYPIMITGFGSADTRPVPGDASKFDPIAALPDIRAYAGESAQLLSIEADYVRSDGTMELTAEYTPYPNVEYEFVREVPRPADAAPVGAGGANQGPWYEPITIKAYKPGQWWHVTSGSSEYSYMNQGMERETSSIRNGISDQIVDDPKCSFIDFWQVALKHDAPQDAVATISYDNYGYEFRITGLSIDMRFDLDCNLTYDSSGPVPTIAPPTSP